MLHPVFKRLRVDPGLDFFRHRTAERLRKMFSPRWVASKLAATAHSLRNPDDPWLVRDAVAALDEWLEPHHKVLEWGSGVSTPWLAERAGSVTSIEHDPEWHRKALVALGQKSLKNAEVRLAVEADYVRQADSFPDGAFDLILNDGLLRGRALSASLSKLKPGGLLVCNHVNYFLPSDSATPHSRSRADGPEESVDPDAFVELQRWKVKWMSDGVIDTAFFWKPEHH